MNAAYPLFPVTIIVFGAWFATWLFSSWDIFKEKTHLKFWNYILLVVFLITGLLGLFSVVKVNYKLVIPNYELYLQWHVSFGIAMVFVSFFHLSYHLKYFFGFRKKKPKNESSGNAKLPSDTPQNAALMLFLLGFATIITQVVFIREFITVLSGNELVTGLVLSGWMILTGWGAFTGRNGDFTALSSQRGILMLSALTIIATVMTGTLYGLKSLLFPPGTLTGLGASSVAVFLLLFPVCFLSGWLFTGLASVWSNSENVNLSGRSYAVEALGSLAGGAIFSLALGRFFTSFQILAITGSLILLAGAWFLKPGNRKTNFSFLLAAILYSFLVFSFNPDKIIKKMLFPNQELILSKSTRYGNLVVTEQAGQLNVYENNDLLFYTHNVMMNEEAVHFAMVQHDNPKSVLLVSGGISGMINEIEKYKVEKITYLEVNPEIFSSLENYADSLDKSGRVKTVRTDIRSFIGKTDEKFDVVLINLPPPSTLGMNRFYTIEFFEMVKKRCTKNAVICTGLPSTANYAEENALAVNSSLWKTLGACFKNQLVLTGERNYFLASDAMLFPDITVRILQKEIETIYVNRFYIDDALLAMRSGSLTAGFVAETPLNRDFKPFMFVKQIGHWLSHFGGNFKWFVLIPLVLFVMFHLKLNRITIGLYTGGFTSASLEVVLLLVWQVWFGSIYLASALFFAVFMAGLAYGSSQKFGLKGPLIKRYYLLQFGLAAFALLLPFVLRYTGDWAAWKFPVQMLLFVLVFVLSTGVGHEFLLATKLLKTNFSETAGSSYSIDLLGSAFGAFIATIVLLPLLGLKNTCLVVAVLNMVSGLFAFSARKTLLNTFS